MAESNFNQPFAENQLFHERYTLLKHLGTGGFAQVWKAHDNVTDTIIALKIFTSLDDKSLRELSQEYRDMQGLIHTNILRAEHFDQWGNIPYLVMKFCAGGALSNYIGQLNAAEIRHVMVDVAKGLSYLHAHQVIHQDIKPANILIDNDNTGTTYILSDFGISAKSRTMLSQSIHVSQSLSLTEGYAPPEKFSPYPQDRKPDRKGDIFSYGISMYELLTGHLPFDDLSTGRQLQYTPNAMVYFGDIADNQLRYLVEQCMQKERNLRPTADAIVAFLQDNVPLPNPNDEMTRPATPRPAYNDEETRPATPRPAYNDEETRPVMPPSYNNQPTTPVYNNQPTTPIYNNQPTTPLSPPPPANYPPYTPPPFEEPNPNKALYYVIGGLVALLIIGGIILAVQASSDEDTIVIDETPTEQTTTTTTDESTTVVEEETPAEEPAKVQEPTRKVSSTPQEYVYLSGILNVEAVEFRLNHDYDDTYRGTFYNTKLGLTMKVEGEFVDGDYFRLQSTDQKTTWTFACNYRNGEFVGTASNGHGVSYDMNVK